MAKKKETASDSTKKPKGFALPAIRGSDEWKAWVACFAVYQRSSLPDLIDKSLVAYAKQVGFRDEPPLR